MRSIWNGDLSFGLVTMHVQIFAATEPYSLGFKMLCGKCHTPLSYERVCSKCKKTVPYELVVKGLKLPDGSYFIVTMEKIKELRPEKTDTIDIVEFIDRTAIKYIYLNNHFFLAPKKAGEKSFYLFKQALEETGKVAIGQFVMRDKQYICIINPYQDALLLTTLFYAYELRSPADIPVLRKKAKVTKAEVGLAKKLIKQLSKKTFKLEAFKDEFAQKLKQAIKKGKKKKIPEKREEKQLPKRTRTKDPLLDSLKASLKTPKRTTRPVARAKAKATRKKYA